jgi:hypothetical protein
MDGNPAPPMIDIATVVRLAALMHREQKLEGKK